MISCRELFYGNIQPTWITRSEEDQVYSSCAYNTYTVPVVELSVSQCCKTKCERKIKNRLFSIPGVDQVIVDYHNQKVTVVGSAGTEKILRQIRNSRGVLNYTSENNMARCEDKYEALTLKIERI